MSGYYDRHGAPLTIWEWAEKFEDTEARVVGYDEVGEAHVSTVWLGLDHAFFGGPPLIFETMIFGGEHDMEQWRYSTEEEALAGHQHALSLLQP